MGTMSLGALTQFSENFDPSPERKTVKAGV